MLGFMFGTALCYAIAIVLFCECVRQWYKAETHTNPDDHRVGGKADGRREFAFCTLIASGVFILVAVILSGIYWACT